jgi:cytochrome c-type biogenesis protein CcmH/NrfG
VTARRVVVALVAALLVYFVLLGERAWWLLTSGRAVLVGLGVGVLILPFLGGYLVVRELQFGLATQRLARDLEAEGGLPVDDLPRRPSGRPDRAAADARFAQRQAEVEAAPDDWRTWFRLGVAYGDAGDTRRGRAAMRHAVRLHSTGPTVP